MGTGRPHYPAFLVVERLPCLVVGAGSVGARKADALAHCGADVTVIAPEVSAAMEAIAARHGFSVERRAYVRGEAARYRLVVSATGQADVDRAVTTDAEAAGVWVNCAGAPAAGTFVVPAVHRDGGVAVAVSTGGASPALAAWLRRRVAAAIGPGIGRLAVLMAEARRTSASRGGPAPDWAGLLEGPLPVLVAEGKLDEARRLLELPPG